jgi:hypothetical protein
VGLIILTPKAAPADGASFVDKRKTSVFSFFSTVKRHLTLLFLDFEDENSCRRKLTLMSNANGVINP